MERLTAEAEAAGMLGRLGCERLLADRVRRADREAMFYRRRMKRVLGLNRVRGLTPEQVAEREAMELDPERIAIAQKWAALSESAEGRGDKAAGRLFVIVTDREARADLERKERRVDGVLDKPRRAALRGAA